MRKGVLVLVGCVVAAVGIVVVLAVLASVRKSLWQMEVEDADVGDLSPAREDGKYAPVFFAPDELNRIIAIHFNVGKLATPLFLCPIERYLTLGPELEVMVFTPDSQLIEDNLPHKNHPQLVYYDYADLADVFSGLPLEPLYRSGVYRDHPKWADMILCDMIKLVAVYTYGGTYTDLDVMPNRVYADEECAVVVPQDRDYIGSAYFRFPRRSPLVWLVMQKIARDHPLEKWASFSTLPLTEVLRERCGVEWSEQRQQWTQPQKNLDAECANLKVLDIEAVYPVHWRDEEMYVRDHWLVREADWQCIKNALGMHWWNGPLKREGRLPPTSLLAYLAAERCPHSLELLQAGNSA